MTIGSMSDLAASARQTIMWQKASANGNTWWRSPYKVAGIPGAGSDPGNTANGVVPTSATAGFPAINFQSGQGFISNIDLMTGTANSYFVLLDRLWHAGAYSFNSNVTLSAQPSYAGRVPNGDYSGLELWFECVTSMVGTLTITVTYTDQDGNTGHSTSASIGSGTTAGSSLPIPFAAGDSGIRKVESVVGSVATGGTFNLFVARRLFASPKIQLSYFFYTFPLDQIGFVEVFPTTALLWLMQNSNNHNCYIEIASK